MRKRPELAQSSTWPTGSGEIEAITAEEIGRAIYDVQTAG
jgi:hypothetical protein